MCDLELTKGQWKALILAYELYDTNSSRRGNDEAADLQRHSAENEASVAAAPSASLHVVNHIVSKVRRSFHLPERIGEQQQQQQQDHRHHDKGQSHNKYTLNGQRMHDLNGVIDANKHEAHNHNGKSCMFTGNTYDETDAAMNGVCCVAHDVHDLLRYLFIGEPDDAVRVGSAARVTRPLTSNEMYLLKRCSRVERQVRQHEERYQYIVTSLSRVLHHDFGADATHSMHSPVKSVARLCEDDGKNANSGFGQLGESGAHARGLCARPTAYLHAVASDRPLSSHTLSVQPHSRDSHLRGVVGSAVAHTHNVPVTYTPPCKQVNSSLTGMHVCEGCQEAGGDLFQCTQCYSVRHEVCGGPHPPDRTVTPAVQEKKLESYLLTPESVQIGIRGMSDDSSNKNNRAVTGATNCNTSARSELTMLCRKCRHELRITTSSCDSSNLGNSNSESSSLRSSTSSAERAEIDACFGSDADDCDTSLSGFIVDSDDVSETSEVKTDDAVHNSADDRGGLTRRCAGKLSIKSQSSSDTAQRRRTRRAKRSRHCAERHGHTRKLHKRASRRRSISYISSSHSSSEREAYASDAPKMARTKASPLSSSCSFSASPAPSPRTHTTPVRDALHQTHILAVSSSRSST